MGARVVAIAVAGLCSSKSWQNTSMTWDEFCEKLKNPFRDNVNMPAYMRMSKAEQDKRKDVGGFVGGSLSGSRRLKNGVTGRDLITLDLDNIASGCTDMIVKAVTALNCDFAIYSTRKHRPEAPRLRVIVPTDRTMSAEEYEPAARMLASIIGIEYCDPTTFEPSRLMFWPSVCMDATYVYCARTDAGLITADGLLARYENWKDPQQWPKALGEKERFTGLLGKQEDPCAKRGLIGAFCREYTIEQAMEKFLPGIYEATDKTDRYTYAKGTTVGGAIVYESKFLYSHHATDPCSGILVNAWDMVRLHLYSQLDTNVKDDTPAVKFPSYIKMTELINSDSQAIKRYDAENRAKAGEAFSEPVSVQEDPMAWVDKLERAKGVMVSSIQNFRLVLENDPVIAGCIAYDDLALATMLVKPSKLCGYSGTGRRMWSDTDDANLRLYFQRAYQQKNGWNDLDSAMLIVAHDHHYNPIESYLKSLKWDGTPRVDELFVRCLGAADTKYTRMVARMHLVASVGRAIVGGTKYDGVPILTGKPGIGKSLLLERLGGSWYSNTTIDIKDTKGSMESLQGSWIIEMGELSSLNKADASKIKNFISTTHDRYRPAYGKRVEDFPRRCTFCGTTNETEFLRDDTGNRRFYPIDCGVTPVEKQNHPYIYLTQDTIGQIWAEAYAMWQGGQQTHDVEIEKEAERQQIGHFLQDPRQAAIEEFLRRKIPPDWYKLDPITRSAFQTDSNRTDLITRDRVSVQEIWTDCLHQDISKMRKSDSRELAGIVNMIGGWNMSKYVRFGDRVLRGYVKD